MSYDWFTPHQDISNFPQPSRGNVTAAQSRRPNKRRHSLTIDTDHIPVNLGLVDSSFPESALENSPYLVTPQTQENPTIQYDVDRRDWQLASSIPGEEKYTSIPVDDRLWFLPIAVPSPTPTAISVQSQLHPRYLELAVGRRTDAAEGDAADEADNADNHSWGQVGTQVQRDLHPVYPQQGWAANRQWAHSPIESRSSAQQNAVIAEDHAWYQGPDQSQTYQSAYPEVYNEASRAAYNAWRTEVLQVLAGHDGSDIQGIAATTLGVHGNQTALPSGGYLVPELGAQGPLEFHSHHQRDAVPTKGAPDAQQVPLRTSPDPHHTFNYDPSQPQTAWEPIGHNSYHEPGPESATQEGNYPPTYASEDPYQGARSQEQAAGDQASGANGSAASTSYNLDRYDSLVPLFEQGIHNQSEQVSTGEMSNDTTVIGPPIDETSPELAFFWNNMMKHPDLAELPAEPDGESAEPWIQPASSAPEQVTVSPETSPLDMPHSLQRPVEYPATETAYGVPYQDQMQHGNVEQQLSGMYQGYQGGTGFGHDYQRALVVQRHQNTSDTVGLVPPEGFPKFRSGGPYPDWVTRYLTPGWLSQTIHPTSTSPHGANDLVNSPLTPKQSMANESQPTEDEVASMGVERQDHIPWHSARHPQSQPPTLPDNLDLERPTVRCNTPTVQDRHSLGNQGADKKERSIGTSNDQRGEGRGLMLSMPRRASSPLPSWIVSPSFNRKDSRAVESRSRSVVESMIIKELSDVAFDGFRRRLLTLQGRFPRSYPVKAIQVRCAASTKNSSCLFGADTAVRSHLKVLPDPRTVVCDSCVSSDTVSGTVLPKRRRMTRMAGLWVICTEEMRRSIGALPHLIHDVRKIESLGGRAICLNTLAHYTRSWKDARRRSEGSFVSSTGSGLSSSVASEHGERTVAG